MDDNEGLATAVALALSQAKRVQRESRRVVQQLGAINAAINPEETPTANRHKEQNDYED